MRQGKVFVPTDLNEPVDPRDPFPYGWRYVAKQDKNGSEIWVKVPLTLEDILHPQEEDFRMLGDPHTEDVYYLRAVFKTVLAEVPGAVVLNDCRVAWDREGEYAHGPDCAVVFHVKALQRWTTFNVVHEQTRPELIIEVTSPSTRSTDLVNKVIEYAEQKIPHYVIVDARETAHGREITLIDYHYSEAGEIYVALPCTDDDRVWLPEVQLWLGAEEGRVVCYDEAGTKQGTYTEICREREAAENARREAETARQKADAARVKAETDRQEALLRAAESEKRTGELEAALNRLRAGG